MLQNEDCCLLNAHGARVCCAAPRARRPYMLSVQQGLSNGTIRLLVLFSILSELSSCDTRSLAGWGSLDVGGHLCRLWVADGFPGLCTLALNDLVRHV